MVPVAVRGADVILPTCIFAGFLTIYRAGSKKIKPLIILILLYAFLSTVSKRSAAKAFDI